MKVAFVAVFCRFSCDKTKVHWNKESQWFETVVQLKLKFSLCKILFGILVTSTMDSDILIFNYLMFLGKWFINNRKPDKTASSIFVNSFYL